MSKVLDDLAAGRITLEEAAADFAARSWPRQPATGNAQAWGGVDDPDPAPDSWTIVNADTRLSPGDYQVLAAAYRSAPRHDTPPAAKPTRSRGPVKRRGPVNHKVTHDDSSAGGRSFPWSPDPAAPGPWTCLCGTRGDGQATAGAHLAAKATAAFARVDNRRAVVIAQVSDTTPGGRDAITILAGNAHWYANPLVRRHMHPYYDRWGCLAVTVDWPALAAADLPGDDPADQLVLRVAASIAGVAVPLTLEQLLWLPAGDARHVRDALLRLLPREDL